MLENYKFSTEAGSFNELTFTEEEENVIKRLGITPDDLRKLLTTDPFAEGGYALLFESSSNDSNLVTKAWKNRSRDHERGENENAALRLLRIRDYKNAPKLRGYLQPSTILFEKKIEGEAVQQFDKNHIERLALALADLHSIRLNAYGKPFTERKDGTRLDYLFDGIENLHKIAEPFIDQTEVTGLINRSLDKIKKMTGQTSDAFSAKDFTLIHFDLHKDNILYSKDDGAPVIVDWEQASAGDNAMDIAKLFLKSNFNMDQKQAFLNVYESQQAERDPHFEDRLKAYEPFVLINSILWRLGVLRDTPQHMSSENEDQFYSRVKFKLDEEMEALKKFVSE